MLWRLRLLVVPDEPTKGRTRSPIKLFWTAKKLIWKLLLLLLKGGIYLSFLLPAATKHKLLAAPRLLIIIPAKLYCSIVIQHNCIRIVIWIVIITATITLIRPSWEVAPTWSDLLGLSASWPTCAIFCATTSCLQRFCQLYHLCCQPVEVVEHCSQQRAAPREIHGGVEFSPGDDLELWIINDNENNHDFDDELWWELSSTFNPWSQLAEQGDQRLHWVTLHSGPTSSSSSPGW